MAPDAPLRDNLTAVELMAVQPSQMRHQRPLPQYRPSSSDEARGNEAKVQPPRCGKEQTISRRKCEFSTAFTVMNDGVWTCAAPSNWSVRHSHD